MMAFMLLEPCAPTGRSFPGNLLSVAKRGLASQGDMEFQQDSNMVVTVWQDTKPVTIMSTQHDPDVTATVKRKKGDGSTIRYNVFPSNN